MGKEDGDSVVAEASRPCVASLLGSLVGICVGSNCIGIVVGKTVCGESEAGNGRGTPPGTLKEATPGLKAPAGLS